MRGRIGAIGIMMALLAYLASMPAFAGNRIFRCVGSDGTLVFRDQPCSRAGLDDLRTRTPALFEAPKQARDQPLLCRFASKPLLLVDPNFASVQLRLVIDIDAEGPYLTIIGSGKYPIEIARPNVVGSDDLGLDIAPDDAEVPAETSLPVTREVSATFDARVASQGLQMSDGAFFETEWRMGEQTLGFGRSRMQRMLSALSRESASVVVWFQGIAQPVQSTSIPAEEFRLAVDNLRRCWKTHAHGVR